METNVAQLGILDRLWTWFETHKKEVFWGVIVVVVVGVGIGLFFWQQNEREERANQALSRITSAGFSAAEQLAAPASLLKVAAEYPKTDAAGRALLLAGANLYAQGKFAEAKTQFEKFLRQYRNSSFAYQALLGVAACLDAQDKIPEAIAAYNDIVQHYSTENVAPQARLALAWFYEKQGRWEQAKDLYIDLSRGPYGSISSEAAVHLEALFTKHPELVPARPASANAPALQLSNP